MKQLLIWSKTLPTEPGEYWMRDSDGGPTLYQCELREGELRCGPVRETHRFPIDEMALSTEWAPSEPSYKMPDGWMPTAQQIEEDGGFHPVAGALSPNSPALAFVQERVAMYQSRFMKLDNPYGEGNHHRISWRRQWHVDDVALTATHKSTGFVMVFTPGHQGRYTARLGFELPPFGPDGTLAMAQMFGLRELLKDGWEIFHQVMEKQTKNQH